MTNVAMQRTIAETETGSRRAPETDGSASVIKALGEVYGPLVNIVAETPTAVKPLRGSPLTRMVDGGEAKKIKVKAKIGFNTGLVYGEVEVEREYDIPPTEGPDGGPGDGGSGGSGDGGSGDGGSGDGGSGDGGSGGR